MNKTKTRAIKVAKRSTGPPLIAETIPLIVQTSVATTVNNWIVERRENSLSENSLSRKTISGWSTELKP
jgi:hypothetical protein